MLIQPPTAARALQGNGVIQFGWIPEADYERDPAGFAEKLCADYNARTMLKGYTVEVRFYPGNTLEPTPETHRSVVDGLPCYWGVYWYNPPGYWDFLKNAKEKPCASESSNERERSGASGDISATTSCTQVSTKTIPASVAAKSCQTKKKANSAQASFFDDGADYS